MKNIKNYTIPKKQSKFDRLKKSLKIVEQLRLLKLKLYKNE